MSRCTVCRRTGHTARKHSGLDPEALAAARAEGLEYMGRGFRELGEPHADGDLLDVLKAKGEAEALAAPAPRENHAQQALRAAVGDVVKTSDGGAESLPEFLARGGHLVGEPTSPMPAEYYGRDPSEPAPIDDGWTSPAELTEREQDERAYSDAVRATSETVQIPRGIASEELLTVQRVAEVFEVPAELLAGGAPLIGDFRQYSEPASCPECFGDLGAHDPACPLAPPVVEDFPDSAGVDGRWHLDEEPDDLDVCTACLGEIAFVPALAGRVWQHTGRQNYLDCDQVRVRWDPATTGPLRLLTWQLPDGQAVMYGHGEHGPQFAPWRTPLGPGGPPLITLPGVYELDADEYHDPAVTGDWLSNSDARQLIDDGCPAQFRYDRDNGVRATSDAFAMGHAVHARILGKGEKIAVRPAKWNDWRTNAAKAWRAEQEAAGKSVILPADAAVVEAMAVKVHEDRWAHALLSQPGRPEVALFWLDPETGVQRRALVDYLPTATNDRGIMLPVDIKSADSVAPTGDMERKLYDHAWHRQGTTIADGIIELGLAADVDFYFIVQSKKAPHLVTVVRLDTEAQRIGRIENRRALLVYKECLETGVWPDYAEEPVTLGVPAWIARQYEDEMVIS